MSPGDALDQPFLLSGVHPVKVDESLDEFGEALVSESSTNNGLGFRDLVPFLERGGVAVGVGDESEGGGDVVRLSMSHELLSGDYDLLVLSIVRGGVEKGEEDTARRPGELVAERVVRAVRSRESTAVREELLDLQQKNEIKISVDFINARIFYADLSTLLVNLVDGLDSVQVVDTWVKADFVHDNDASITSSLVKSAHGG